MTVTVSSVDTNIYTSNQAVGNSSEKEFCFCSTSGSTATKLQVYKTDAVYTGIRMWMSDGTSFFTGSEAEDSDTLTIPPGGLVNMIQLYANNTGVLMISFWVGSGAYPDVQHCWVDNPSGDKAEWYFTPPGSMMLCGMFGHSGDKLDSLGFAMMNPVKNGTLIDVTYPDLDLLVAASTPIIVAQEKYVNNTTVDQSSTLSGSNTVTVATEWSKTTSVEMNYSMSVTAGIPEVADVSTGFSWTTGGSSTQDMASKQTSTQTWSWPIICPANTTIIATGTYYQDQINTKYQGTLKLVLMNGTVVQYPVTGTYQGANVRTGNLDIETVPPVSKM